MNGHKYLLFALFSLRLCASEQPVFVTFATEDYMPLTEVLVKSIGVFSKYNVVVYGINCTVPFSYPHLIQRRIDVDWQADTGDVHFQKFTCLIDLIENMKVKKGMWVDADLLVNYPIDDLFARIEPTDRCPVVTVHNGHGIGECGPVRQWLGVKREEVTTPYLHTCLFLFNENCLPFFKDCQAFSRQYKTRISTSFGHRHIIRDERVINAMTWKYRGKKYLDIYAPFLRVLPNYLEQTKMQQGKGDFNLPLQEPQHRVAAYAFHGEKDVAKANALLQTLIEKKGSNIWLN